ncbi:MAG TPA: hypothetical protein VFG69_05965, partial [Nannocystaceae bacterium]|nr:hypothetical protein [Nannocystaceae bacterium]
MLASRVIRVQAAGLFVAFAPACTKPPESTPTPAESPKEDQPVSAKPVVPTSLGATLEVVITQRSYVGWGSAHRISIAGERAMLYAGAGT